MKIAVFPASSETGLEIIRSLSDLKDIEVWGIDSIDGVAKYVCNNYKSDAPYCGEEGLREYFKDFDWVYPTNELALMEFKDYEFSISHPEKTIKICNSKYDTYTLFKELVPVPDTYPNVTWSKPSKGHSGIGQSKVVTKDIHCEWLPGHELTIECFTSEDELIYCKARTRSRVSNGIAVESSRIEIPTSILSMAYTINSELEFKGAWFFQVKQDVNGRYKLLEIGARIAGSSGLNRAEGVNLPLLTVYEHIGIPFEIKQGEPKSIKRYLTVKADLPKIDRLYVDYDDTLMINGKINWKVMALVYKLNVPTYILTINPDNENVKLDPFKGVIVEQNKAKYSTNRTMLIDDSFRERKDWENAISPQEIDLYL